MTKTAALKLALEALEKVTTEMLALKDELAERGARPTTNVFHQRLWDSSFKAYTDHALPAATAIREALAQLEQELVATDWERIARVQDAKLRAVCNEAGGFEKLCEVMDKYERTTPPQRTWVGLTDEDFLEVCQIAENGNYLVAFRRIQAKLKEKNT